MGTPISEKNSKDIIFSTAAQLFAQKGYNGVSMREGLASAGPSCSGRAEGQSVVSRTRSTARAGGSAPGKA